MNDPDFRAPWEIVDYGYGLKIEPDICWIGDNSNVSKEKQAAIARLIKVAPKMYDMLAFLLEFVEEGGNEGEIRECYAPAIKELLNEARGER